MWGQKRDGERRVRHRRKKSVRYSLLSPLVRYRRFSLSISIRDPRRSEGQDETRPVEWAIQPAIKFVAESGPLTAMASAVTRFANASFRLRSCESCGMDRGRIPHTLARSSPFDRLDEKARKGRLPGLPESWRFVGVKGPVGVATRSHKESPLKHGPEDGSALSECN
jgi:hypothetical protein